MNRTLLGIFAVALCFTVAHTLQCYNCDIGFWDLCVTTKQTCNAGELCYSGVGKAAGIIKLKMKGCLKEADCNKTSDVNFPPSSNSSIYQMTKTCCYGELCNAAPGLSLHTLTLAAASITSLIISKVLV
ncbi:sperm acrosome membrane-associated protein 4 [Colossoma macropomum]|uniref:sperm acrosome membrane-associated protein 4 n=1 Tax=Colossoma macropomum TaxID=42526 RepID=UPI001864189F|nr:sperm acrosome membrane-associated protein 4 [Colossoma macropomum]